VNQLVLLAVLIFFCGAFYECMRVGFVVFANNGKAGKTAMYSGLSGLAEITGIFGTVHDWHLGPFFLVGLMTGSYIGVHINKGKIND
jgi:hypothetical protein